MPSGPAPRNQERNVEIARLYREGVPITVIGPKFGITRERVRQLLKQQGLTRKDGGAYLAKQRRLATRLARREAECQRRFGHSWAEHRQILDTDLAALRRGLNPEFTVLRRYYRNRVNIRRLGITWSLTFAEWWTTWQASGRWALYGRGKGFYCLSRIDKLKGFEAGNVQVAEFQAVTKAARAPYHYWCPKKESSTPEDIRQAIQQLATSEE